MSYVELTSRMLIAFVFLAATAKLRSAGERAEFVAMVGALRLLPTVLIRPAAFAVAARQRDGT